MLFTLTLATLLGLGTQQINCFPADPLSNDRAVLSFKLPSDTRELPTEGTLFLSSGIDDNGEQDSSGVLKLSHVPETDEDAAKGLVRYQAQNETSIFSVMIAEKDIGKTLKDFSLSIELSHTNDSYKTTDVVGCYATVFPE